MDKLLLLRGKLEMAKRTIQLQKTSFAKKLAGDDKGEQEVLVYKDAPDADSSEEDKDSANDDEQMGEGDDSNDEGMSDGSQDDSSEEEIKEIPLKKLAEKSLKKKRAKHASDEDELGYGSEDESGSSDDDRYEKEPVK